VNRFEQLAHRGPVEQGELEKILTALQAENFLIADATDHWSIAD
jgi:hypothetical protein